MEGLHSFDWVFPNKYQEVYRKSDGMIRSLIRNFTRHFPELASEVESYRQPESAKPIENRALIVRLRNGVKYEYKDCPFSDYGELRKIV